MKRLLLLRHAEANPAAAADSDFDRALSERGRAQALAAAQRLLQMQCIPDVMLASPALRTRETATIVAARLECLQALRYAPQCYPGSVDSLLQVIREAQDDPGTLLLVGHNPGLSALARRLDASVELAPLTTGGLCGIELSVPTWSQIETRASRA